MTDQLITATNRRSARTALCWLFGGLLIATVLVRYTEPINDGDIFFHLVYGRTILENKTLTPDHSIYSWTDTRNNPIYCAWLGQLALYLLHRVGGFPLLFFFKYLCVSLYAGICWVLLRKNRFESPLFPLLLLLMVSIGANSGVFLKPEIFSLVFMAIFAFFYFQAKLSTYCSRSCSLLFGIPILFLLWINLHGVWMFGFIVFSLMLTGELLNKYFGNAQTVSPLFLKNLSISYALTLPILLINPYGWSYAIEPISRVAITLFPSLNASSSDLGVEHISAYKPIFNTIKDPIVTLWAMMAALFLFYFVYHVITHKRPDWAILSINMFLGFLFARYIRCSYYWGPFWCLSILYLSTQTNFPPYFKGKTSCRITSTIVALAFLLFSSLAIYKSIFSPRQNSWFGFGLNDWAPVDETAFLKLKKPGKRLYNSYKTGAYLMYALFPEYKVFIDARRFPYQKVFDDDLAFQNGRISLDDFNQIYPFDVALADYSGQKMFIQFFNSREWSPIYYGASAAVFIKNPSATDYNGIKHFPLNRFDRLNNLKDAARVCAIAMNFDDMAAAEYIFKRIRKQFFYIEGYEEVLANVGDKIAGLKAYQNGYYDTAFQQLSRCDDQTVVPVTRALIDLRLRTCRRLIDEKKFDQALGLMEMNLRRLPDQPNLWYATGVLAYFSQQDLRNNSRKYEYYLNQFISRFPTHPHAEIAREILQGRAPLQIPLGL